MTINTLKTLEIIVQNSKTMEELKNAEKMLKEKKRWIRKLSFNPSQDLYSLLFPKEDVKLDFKHVEEALERLNSAPQSIQDELLKHVKESEDIAEMMKKVEEMQQIVTKKMKDIIWSK